MAKELSKAKVDEIMGKVERVLKNITTDPHSYNVTVNEIRKILEEK